MRSTFKEFSGRDTHNSPIKFNYLSIKHYTSRDNELGNIFLSHFIYLWIEKNFHWTIVAISFQEPAERST